MSNALKPGLDLDEQAMPYQAVRNRTTHQGPKATATQRQFGLDRSICHFTVVRRPETSKVVEAAGIQPESKCLKSPKSKKSDS